MMGKNIFNLVPEYKELGLKEIAESLKAKKTVMTFGYTLNSRDGSVSHHECFLRALFDTENKLVEFQSLSIDITEQTVARAEKEELEKKITQMQTMETIGKLASGIAHDFNNILAPLMGHMEMALALSKNNNDAYMHLEEATKAAYRSRDLVRNILSFGRQKTNDPRGIRLQDVIMESLALIKASMPSNIKTIKNIGSDCSRVVADSTQIQRIIVNLCTNAFHSMKHNGGVLGIDLSEKTLPYNRGGKKDDSKNIRYVHLQVSDTGCGIDPSIINHIFDPYFTTKNADEGTGLGLASVKEIIRKYNCDVFVESVLGKGSIFHVFLPAAENNDRELSAETIKLGKLNRDKDHIMLVDDEEVALRSISRVLEAIGYRVTSFNGGEQALKTFRNHKNAFDLLMTDFNMPGLTGVQLAREIIAFRPDMPVLIFTGSRDVVSKIPDGMDFLIKPVATHELASKLNSLFSKSKELRHPGQLSY